MTALAPLPVPVEFTEEGYDYPPIIDYRPGLPGRKNAPPKASTAELFREYQHFGLRRTRVMPAGDGPSIMLPKSCEQISQEGIVVERPLADCGLSKVLLVKVKMPSKAYGGAAQHVPCVARLVQEPTRQFWREVGVWSSLRHDNIVRFVGVCISAQGPLSLCLHFPEGSVYDDNARLRSTAPANAPVAWGLRSGWTLVRWVTQLVDAMNYLHGLKPWPVLYRNLKSSNVMLSEQHSKISLTDFAICRPLALHDDVTPAQGSDRWLAPEALLGRQFDLAGDVFSFALTCWEFSACDIPYALHSSRQAAMLIVEGLRPMVPPHCPDWLTKLMAACNAHLPEARPTFAAIHAAMSDPAASDVRGLAQNIDQLLQTSEQVMLSRVNNQPRQPPPPPPPQPQQLHPSPLRPQQHQPQQQQHTSPLRPQQRQPPPQLPHTVATPIATSLQPMATALTMPPPQPAAQAGGAMPQQDPAMVVGAMWSPVPHGLEASGQPRSACSSPHLSSTSTASSSLGPSPPFTGVWAARR